MPVEEDAAREVSDGPPTIVTERLVLRAFRPADVEPLFAIQRDPVAMQHTFTAASRADSERFLAKYAALFPEHGFAPWTVVLRSEERVVAWGGISVDPFDPGWGIEIGYFVDARHWGRGIASEIVSVSLRYGFTALGLAKIGAFTRPANAASQRVLEKAGFRFRGYEPKIERNRYAIARADWRSRSAPAPSRAPGGRSGS